MVHINKFHSLLLGGIVLIASCFQSISQTVTDIDGNVYNTVTIGSQTWIQQDLRTLHYPDGSPISEVWSYDDNDSLANIYGKLYTWDAAMNYSTIEKAQGICPDGWHIPSDEEWTELGNILGGDIVAGGKMKETGSMHWNEPNTGATNESGFTSLPAGEYDDTHYQLLGTHNVIWSSTEASTIFAIYRYTSYDDAELSSYTYYKDFRYSVRCIKNNTVGVNDTKKINLRVFPNPVDMVLNLQQAKPEPKSTTVYDQVGKEVINFKFSEEKHCEDIHSLEPGIYIMKVENGTSCCYYKIIKK